MLTDELRNSLLRSRSLVSNNPPSSSLAIITAARRWPRTKPNSWQRRGGAAETNKSTGADERPHHQIRQGHDNYKASSRSTTPAATIGGGFHRISPLPPPQPPTPHNQLLSRHSPLPAHPNLLPRQHSDRSTGGPRKVGRRRISAWGLVPPSTFELSSVDADECTTDDETGGVGSRSSKGVSFEGEFWLDGHFTTQH